MCGCLWIQRKPQSNARMAMVPDGRNYLIVRPLYASVRCVLCDKMKESTAMSPHLKLMKMKFKNDDILIMREKSIYLTLTMVDIQNTQFHLKVWTDASHPSWKCWFQQTSTYSQVDELSKKINTYRYVLSALKTNLEYYTALRKTGLLTKKSTANGTEVTES